MLKLQTLNLIAAMCGKKDLGFKDKYFLIAATVCPPDDGRYTKPACPHHTCKECGVGQLRDKLFPRATTEPGYKLSPGAGRPGSVAPGDG